MGCSVSHVGRRPGLSDQGVKNFRAAHVDSQADLGRLLLKVVLGHARLRVVVATVPPLDQSCARLVGVFDKFSIQE
jgi:hypothetical protein